MDRTDSIWLWILTALAFLAAALRLLLAKKQGSPLPRLLAKKQGSPLPRFWRIQSFVFPVILLAAAILFQTGTADIVFPAVLIGIAEELILGAVRKRKEKQEPS